MRFDADRIRMLRDVGGLAALIAVSGAGLPFLPAGVAFRVALGLLAPGILFDVGSAYYHVMTLVTGKFMSGFPGVGLVFYVWFLGAAPFTLVGRADAERSNLLACKFADALILLAFHAPCQSPMLLQKPRRESP